MGVTGTLPLDARGNPTAAWLFKIGSMLITASNAAVVLINGATSCNNNVTWEVGRSATLGSGTSFVGNILASASITLSSTASSTGGLYADTSGVSRSPVEIPPATGFARAAPVPSPAFRPPAP